MNKIVGLIFSVVFFNSCHKHMYDYDYNDETNYRYSYVVDTISLKDPIIIALKGGRFVISRHLLDSVVIDKSFTNRPDVFILGVRFYDDLYSEDFKRYSYPEDGGCSFNSVLLSQYKNISFFEYKTAPRFILQLVNVNHYNKTHNSYNGYEINNNQTKNSYYKIVFPLCN